MSSLEVIHGVLSLISSILWPSVPSLEVSVRAQEVLYGIGLSAISSGAQALRVLR